MRPLREEPNLNGLWGRLIIEELRRQGVACFVVCPGSRSTPLARAVAELGGACRVTFIDERGAGYFALGWARATRKAAAVITTSGTAVANLLPAVMEADLDGVPLVVLTADRPPELRACAANQTVPQVGVFAGSVRWQVDLPAPDDSLPARFVLTTVDQAMRHAHAAFGGPVHLNCAFRDPLPPVPQPYDHACMQGLGAWEAGDAPFTRHLAARGHPGSRQLAAHLSPLLGDSEPGLIVAAGACAAVDPDELLTLASTLGWPIYPDIRSGLRLGPSHPWVLPHLDLLLGSAYRPTRVLQLGARPLSARLERYVASAELASYTVAALDLERVDPAHRVTQRITGDLAWVVHELGDAARACGHRPNTLPSALRLAHEQIEDALQAALGERGPASEPAVARWLTRHAAPDQALFVSSSMPIRDLARFGVLGGPALGVAANRGASGIDGVLASAAGFARARQELGLGRTTLLIGDLALLHDLSTLASLEVDALPLTVVVLNNGGGGIFSLLPIAQHPEVLTPWVQTPHSHRFGAIAQAFGMAHRSVSSLDDLSQGLARAWSHPGMAMLEVNSDLESNRREHERLDAAIAQEAAGS